MLNIAHRGAPSLAPENTLASAKKAKEVGADLWETDVTVTADGKLILLHDDTLSRTTNARQIFPGRVPWTAADYTLKELRTLDAGSWFLDADPFGQIKTGLVSASEQQEIARQKIPTLEDALVFTKEADWRINLELKTLSPKMQDFPLVKDMLNMIDRLQIEIERVIISSFYHPYLEQVRAINPDMVVQALIDERNIGVIRENVIRDNHCEFQTYNLKAALFNEDIIRKLVDKGLTINVNTINDARDMKRFKNAGVSGIFTDFPQRFKQWTEEAA